MRIPDIQLFSDARSFLREFLEVNQPEYSHRKLAALFDWPSSLLSDITQGRRSLAISRAIEFARRTEMTTMQTEKLLMLALKENENTHVRQFANDYFLYEGRPLEQTIENTPPSPDAYGLPDEWTFDRSLCTLMLFLEWTNGQTNEEEIGELLYLFPELKDRSVLQSKIQKLRDHGYIEGELPHLKVRPGRRETHRFTRKHFLATLPPLQGLAEGLPDQVCWHHSHVLIPRDLYGELIERQANFINWIMNQSFDQPRENSDRRDCLPLQVNFMITNLIDLKKAKLQMQIRSYCDQSIEKI